MISSKVFFTGLAIALLITSTGCSAFVGGSEPVGETTTPRQTPEPTEVATKTPTTTPEATETESTPVTTGKFETETEPKSEELSTAEKFERFDRNVEEVYELDGNDRYVYGVTHPGNNSYHLTIRMRNTTNRNKTVEDRLDPLWTYIGIVKHYNKDNDNYEERDHTYIPDTVNITFVTQEGEVFETSYIRYIWAYKYYTDEWSLRVLMGKYSTTIEEGAGHHEKWK